MGLQRGVPLFDFVRKMSYTRFEPSGMTENPEIRFVTSIIDYIFRYLGKKFLTSGELAELGFSLDELPKEIYDK
jgi:ribonucleoside-diphosphate reductase alpha chain